ncbi:DUF4148 domain-containing protein [Variovorax sp. Sphag1AA]|uniref:DUF4148 domain-containing protein n=1 Tax=Variovorax sp. Sphag1AA TaxID=2587027 RepID=UPI00160B4F5A|nr:DUF4148 domain-containing protein [Variovorax sp. Sphag1AA]MBB3182048.1 hypothetical protein [Variovorax sp. Sphag1AA]
MHANLLSRWLIALSAGSVFAVNAQAFQGEQNPLPLAPFLSTQSRASVEMQARTPMLISNGGTGAQSRPGMADRATVRAEARSIAARGAAAYGDN